MIDPTSHIPRWRQRLETNGATATNAAIIWAVATTSVPVSSATLALAALNPWVTGSRFPTHSPIAAIARLARMFAVRT